MQFPILKILGELRANLPPKFKELAVRPTVGAINSYYAGQTRDENGSARLAISFQNTDGTVFSPIELRLPFSDENGVLTPNWQGATLISNHWSQDLYMGETGWQYLRFNEEWVASLPDDETHRNEQILAGLNFYSLIHVTSAPEKITRSYDFARAHTDIDMVICDLEGAVLGCSRINGFDGYDFKHPNGEAWRVEFRTDEAVLLVDGTLAASTAADEPSRVFSMISNKLDETEDRDRSDENASDLSL